MSALGPKQTWAVAPHMSAFGGKADIAVAAFGCAGRFGTPSGVVILFQWLTGVCKNSTEALFHIEQFSSNASKLKTVIQVKLEGRLGQLRRMTAPAVGVDVADEHSVR